MTMTFKEYAEKIHKLDDFLNILNSYGITYTKENGRYKAICPLHQEKTPSFFVTEKNGKATFKCFGCGKGGDVVDFIQIKEGISKFEALKKAYELLNLKLDLKPSKLDNLEKYIYDKMKKDGYRIEDIYIYMTDDNIPSILRIKYRSLTDKSTKDMGTYKVIDKGKYYQLTTKEKGGEYEYTIYNYPRIRKSIEKGQSIYIVEGEKDAETLIKLGLAATTFCTKSWKDIYTKQLQNAKIIFIGDTGKAGEEFKNFVWNNLKNIATSFKIVTLPGLEELGDNKDVTDWLEAGHKKSELMEIVNNRTLDLLNKYEFQQDQYGIYKISFKDDNEIKTYISNFSVISCEIIRNQDSDDQIIKMKLRSNLGYTSVIEANARECFADVKTFKKVLGIDYTFTGNAATLTQLQIWIIKYFVVSDTKNYTITGIRKINDEYVLVTNHGILYKNGEFDTTIKAINPYHDINFEGIEILNTQEATELAKHLFKFNSKINVYNTLGLGIAYMLNTFIRESSKDNLPVLQDIGESNSGKSKAFDILRHLYNNTNASIDFSNITQFSLQKALADTYLPVFIDELKPSKTPQKLNILSSFIRGVTEGYTAFKGTKNQSLKTYKINGTLILSGEEEIQETAIKNRSNIVWYSKADFTPEGEAAIKFLCQSEYGKQLLRRFSKSLYLHILNNYSKEILQQEYEKIYDEYKFYEFVDSSRECNTAVYTMLGLKILIDTFNELGVNLEEIEINLLDGAIDIAQNIVDNVLGGVDAKVKSEYEIILEVIDHLAGIKDEKCQLIDGMDYKEEEDCLALKIPNIWDKLERYYKTCKSEKIPIDKNTFTKSLKKSKYFIKYDNVYFNEYAEDKNGDIHFKTKRGKAYKLNKKYLLELDINNLIDIEDNTKKEGKIINF